MSEYSAVTKSKLKLKADSGVKKKKKSRERKDVFEKIAKVEKSQNSESVEENKPKLVSLTKAERAFLKMKEKKQMERILDKASKTHKQRVEEFNRHLDSLTEHYDIPKVSWTK
ncbi:protein FAM32A isoform X2 [Parasteatoda tepidariorum]|uniref:protein FAM32A isoform X2 n=1 Tax=Parasteatoda tepidariorum TaxID=114398 RepID=UPI00077FD735|nr:protein FAM32A isoform X3 [Parasteatoda tepidariorum]